MKLENILEDIKSRLDIVELISDYVALKKAGANYKGLCPFHSEKTPSFMVSPQKQIFHCFGCHTGGDIVGFVMKYENLSFLESVRLLAKRAGMRLTEIAFKDNGNKEVIKDIHKTALSFFTENLRRSKQAFSYLLQRGLFEETIRDFSLGYAGKDWHCLYEHLKAKGYHDHLILESGLGLRGERGIYDTFRDRIIFPIFNLHGDVIAFGGRVMDNSMPKYLNSPDTLLFKKGETLYGLYMAEKELRKKDNVVIVEGYFDVIMCHQSGIRNTVAPLGTALTQGHLRRLKRFTNNILLIFDGDSAGIMAAKRSLSLILEHGMRADVLLLPEGHDPDSLLREKGGGQMEGLMKKARPPLDFLLLTSRLPKTETVREILGIISMVNDRILQEELLRGLSEKTKIRESVLMDELQKLIKPAPIKRSTERSAYDEEFLLLSAIISVPEKIETVLKNISTKEIKDSRVRKVIEEIALSKDLNLITEKAEEEEKSLIRMLTLKPGFDPHEAERVINDCIRKIKKRLLDEKITLAQDKGDLRLLSHLIRERKQLIGGIR